MYWDQNFPRLITGKKIKIMALEKELRLFAIADVTCDLSGSIDFFTEPTSFGKHLFQHRGSLVTPVDKPFFMYDPTSGRIDHAMDKMKDGIVYLGVDHWPAEVARDASEHFSSKLGHMLPAIARSDKNLSIEEQALPSEIQRAVICNNGKLLRDFE